MTFTKFEEIEAWKRGCRLAADIQVLCKTESISMDWSLKDQIKRAAISISSNIAEGYERKSSKSNAEFIHFLYIAKGSCAELKTQIYIAEASSILSSAQSKPFKQECTVIAAMIGALIEYLKKTEPSKKRNSKTRKPENEN